MTVNVRPLHDRVLVRRVEEKETAKGGIIIPDSAREKLRGCWQDGKGPSRPTRCKVGDRILFGKYTGNDIQEYLILREDEILAKVGAIAKAGSGKI